MKIYYLTEMLLYNKLSYSEYCNCQIMKQQVKIYITNLSKTINVECEDLFIASDTAISDSWVCT